jgi:ribonuclease T1
LLALTCAAVNVVEARTPAAQDPASAHVTIAELPPEARVVLRAIKLGGPFPYAKDGAVFSNREHHLPRRPSGYYHEYTVATPGARDRGARRIIAGRDGEFYYTDDHYRRFKRIVE